MHSLLSAVSHALFIITIVDMDRASQVLAQGIPSDVPTLSKWGDVSFITLCYRAHGRLSVREKTQRQQYLIIEEKKALVTFLLLMFNFGHSVQIKYIFLLIFSFAFQRFTTMNKFSSKNWARAFEKRHSKFKAKRVKSIDWKRYKNNTYDVKIVYWFEMIEKIV